MNTIIIGCSGAAKLAKKVADIMKLPYSELIVRKFPDSETYIKFDVDVRGKTVVLFQSFYGNVNDCLIEVVFASYTAKDLGAKKVILIAPYFPYMRQDKRFTSGEAISVHIIGDLADHFWDEIMIFDPHLHREKTLSHIFNIKTVKLSANPLIADYIKNKIENPILIGPDSESYKWAQKTAEIIGCESAIMEKERHSATDVSVKLNKKVDLFKKTVVLVDDMISTGGTIVEASKLLKKIGAKKITVICVHGIFANNSLSRLKKEGIEVVSTNTIPNTTSKIDVSKVVVECLKRLIN